MPHFLATSRIVVRAKPVFWKSWSDTSRIFFFVASFLVSRRPISPLGGNVRQYDQSDDKADEPDEHPGAQEPEDPGAAEARAKGDQPGGKSADSESDGGQDSLEAIHDRPPRGAGPGCRHRRRARPAGS